MDHNEVEGYYENNDENYLNYSVGDSEPDDSRVDFKIVTSAIERNEHIFDLWRVCFLRSIGAS